MVSRRVRAMRNALLSKELTERERWLLDFLDHAMKYGRDTEVGIRSALQRSLSEVPTATRTAKDLRYMSKALRFLLVHPSKVTARKLHRYNIAPYTPY